jgi:large subunit ribosomal protein L15
MPDSTPKKIPILSRLRAPVGAVKSKVRVGRGIGSGLGKTAGRGSKGQYARNTVRPGFEGGQTPLYRRLPKIGFKNPFSKSFAIVNVGELARFDAGATVDTAALVEKRLVRKNADLVKVLGSGSLDRALTIRAHAFSEGAKAAIEKAGGRAEVIEQPKPAEA